jgi:hypothetical protein
MTLRLYMVYATSTDWDTFHSAVVYAHNHDDAVAIVQAEIDKPGLGQAAGRWEPVEDGATLIAHEVPAVRGPVLGHNKAC